MILRKIIILIILFNSILNAIDDKLYGMITKISPEGVELPESGIEIRIYDTQISSITKNGRFVFDLKNFKAGDKIRLEILNQPDWFFYIPNDGEFFRPKNLKDNTIKIKLVGSESKITNKYYNIKIGKKNPKSTKKIRYVIQIVSTNKQGARDIKEEFNNNIFFKKSGYIAYIEPLSKKENKVFVDVKPSTISQAKRMRKYIREKKYKDAFIRLTYSTTAIFPHLKKEFFNS